MAAERRSRWCNAAHRSITSPFWPHRASKQQNTLSSRFTLKVRPRPSPRRANLQQEVAPQQTERPPRDSSFEDTRPSRLVYIDHTSRPGRHDGVPKVGNSSAGPAAELVVRVRHEGVAETVVLFGKEVTLPAVPPAVPYRGVRPWQRGRAEPSGQRILTRQRVAAQARADAATASTRAVGDQGCVVRSTQLKCRKRRHQGQAKGADRLGPKGTWPGPGAPNSPGADGGPPAKRRGLTHEDSGDATCEARRPPARVDEPQGEPMGRRVKDGGGSEGRPVTGRIGVATSPRAKASPLPPGVGGREPTANRLGGQSRSVAGGNARGAAPAESR